MVLNQITLWLFVASRAPPRHDYTYILPSCPQYLAEAAGPFAEGEFAGVGFSPGAESERVAAQLRQ